MALTENDLFKIPNTILLLGETGVGKSHLAHKIHLNSELKNNKFVVCNLATLSENLIESELFGHVKGAFTSANEYKQGILQFVNKGTLFLDEVGELSLDMQKRLLYLLEKSVYRPVGSNIEYPFKGRLILATNKNLKEMVRLKSFRADLYYRMSIFNFTLPPLRNSPEKIEELLQKFLQGEFVKLDFRVLLFLKSYSWPGNIRELKNLCDYFLALAFTQYTINDLPDWMGNESTEEYSYKSYYEARDLFEKKYLSLVLQRHQMKINQTARAIKLSKNSLLNKIKKYEIAL